MSGARSCSNTAGAVPSISSVLVAWTLTTTSAIAAPVLRSADIEIAIASPTSCEVTMTLVIEGAPEIEHRVDAPAGVELISVQGARQIGELRTIGTTQSLVLRPDAASYTFRYHVQEPRDRAYRCPMWLPTVPADGLSRAVRFQIALPSSAVPGNSMPAFTWNGSRGSTTLGHIPAFVRAPFGQAGDARGLAGRSLGEGWDVARLMDTAAVVVFAGASALWLLRRRR
jgi:hypothetical protein